MATEVDFIKNRITLFTVRGDLDSGLPVIESHLKDYLLSGQKPVDSKKKQPFLSQYKLSGRWQNTYMAFSEHDSGINFQLRGGAGRLRRSERVKFEPVENALKALSDINFRCHIHWRVRFELPNRNFKPVLSFPIKLFQGDVIPFDNVVGVRLEARRSGLDDRSLVIDSYSRTIDFHLTLGEEKSIGTDLVAKLIKQGKDYIRPFLIRSKEVDAWY